MSAYAGAEGGGGGASPAGFSAASRPVRLSAAVLREVAPPKLRRGSSASSLSAPSGPFLPNSTDRAIAREIGDLIADDSMERVEDRVDEMFLRAEAKAVTAFGHVPEDDGQGSMSAQVLFPAPARCPPRCCCGASAAGRDSFSSSSCEQARDYVLGVLADMARPVAVGERPFPVEDYGAELERALNTSTPGDAAQAAPNPQLLSCTGRSTRGSHPPLGNARARRRCKRGRAVARANVARWSGVC